MASLSTGSCWRRANSDHAGHRPAFVQFAQALHFDHLAAVYDGFDFDGPLEFVRKSAGLSERIAGRDRLL